MSLQTKVQNKLTIRDSSFPKEWLIPESELPKTTNVIKFIENSNYLTPEELEITGSSALQLLDAIKDHKYTSLTITKAFAHRATIAHQLTNCLTEVFFTEAFKQAQELDDYYKTTGELKGPLHGLPISLKDEFNIIGQFSTIGLVDYIDHDKLSKDSPNVAILRQAGAIFYVKTNIPTGVFNNITANSIFGKTVSPFNTNLISGGSSGGEASLVALRGSPLGIGSDMGGSVRQPASLQNLFGFKPSSQRTPHDTTSIVEGLEAILATNGVLSTNFHGLELYIKTIVDSKSWLRNSRVVPIPWTPIDLSSQKLRFGLLLDDGVIKPSKPVKRALEKVRESLINQGYEVIEWQKADLIQSIAKFSSFMMSNGCKPLLQALESGKEPTPDFLKTFEDLPSSKLMDLQYERYQNCNQFWEEWEKLGLDGLISPVSPIAGAPFDGFIDFGYSPLANILDTPAGTFPVLEVDQELDRQGVEGIELRNDMEKAVHQGYDVEKIDGCVVGLQILGRKLQEEKTLELIKIVSTKIGTFDYWKK
ncbi:hypothetical protein BN7_4455 [Wickerhamomyces ciferrii]|uniref:amidase n=1 Tax=Wickerhamomyces ciferrii (strain ATCC 14091 / BCRC 22168 / CBS 111 / JCM 3599 / NBRC 0793 / NRRL Y-1031 F-60-10) TaxID=1206466 RepID=K0KPH9_WICCF|nr:uncharacterized protein BN7_4455 [Wickerhamomyces ciferrii]CCH44886.1 hypothetical protein BN7_4455 [Wickerhamomyces ciferrii]